MSGRLFLLVGLIVVLAGSTTYVGAQPRTTITLWYPGGDVAAGPTTPFHDPTLFQPFEVANNVKVDLVPLDYDTMEEKIFAAAAAHNVADIVFLDTGWVSGFLKEGLLDQVEPAKAKKWLASVTPEVVTFSDYGHGDMWGYPQMGFDVYGLTWNKQQFKAAGLNPDHGPRTWDELRQACRKLAVRDATGTLTRVGFAIRHVGNPHGVVDKFVWALWDAGGDLVDDPNSLRGGHVAFDNAAGRAALNLILDMLNTDKCTSLNFPDPRAAFLKGIASMQISETVSIRARQPQEAPDMPWGSGWGMEAPPVPKAGDKAYTLVGGWLFSVPKAAKNREMAWKAIEWANTEINDYNMAAKYGMTPRYKNNWAKEPFKSDGYDQALLGIARYARRYPLNLGVDGISEALGNAIEKAWHGEATVDQALAEAAQLGNKAIADAAK
jgi:multiple sugar transport system substrate-binding protein